MGTPDFAVESLQILVDHGYEIVGVVTATDKLGGRGGNQLIESAVKKYASGQNLKVLQPTNLKSPEFLEELKSLNADVQIVVAFRMLPEVVWSMPPMGTYNIHASLLPKYRGAAPINWAIINGETETGVTCFKLKHEIDTGDLLLQKSVPILPEDNFGTMYEKLKKLGATVLLEAISKIRNGDVQLLNQQDSEVTHAPKIFSDDCKIRFNQPAEAVHNFIRGMAPYPAAYFTLNQKIFKVLESSFDNAPQPSPPGQIITSHKSKLGISCNPGVLYIESIKPEGKKLMNIRDFLNGHKIESNLID
jgi:methionyl-tRNA formyltransferase